MKPIDHRNITWEGIQNHLHGYRLQVLHSLLVHGPCTTRELAAHMKWDILRVRPRVTELYQLGYVVEVTADDTPTREGTYKALTDEEAFESFRARKFPQNYQLDLKNL